MGTLVAWHYPTSSLLWLADHTYVACGSGKKAWGCWGGKRGGKPLRRGQGSTLRADAIAEPDERANITCYLINGVCHQAANRILYAAGGIDVSGAGGYRISEGMYSRYGRPRGFIGFCQAPFHRHPSVSGDLPECQAPEPSTEVREPAQTALVDRRRSYLSAVDAAYRAFASQLRRDEIGDDEAMAFQLRLFGLMIDHRLQADLDTRKREALLELRKEIEERRWQLEASFFHRELSVRQFVDAFNELTITLQDGSAEILSGAEYRALYDASRDERWVVGDPEIAEAAYPDR